MIVRTADINEEVEPGIRTLHKRILIQIETKTVWAGLTISGTRQNFREELRILLYDLDINKY